MASWTNLKESLISHLVQKGLAPAVVPGFLRCLALSLGIAPHPDIVRIKQRMRRMGWTECEIDADTLALAKACFSAQGLQDMDERPARWFEKNYGSETHA